MALRSSAVATPPVGLCGELRNTAFGRVAVLRKSATALTSGRKAFGLRQRHAHRHRPAAADVRLERRELRREEQNRVAGFEEQLAEELLEHLRAGADDHVLRPGRHAELRPDGRGDLLAELGQARSTGSSASGRPRIAFCPAARADLVLGNGLSPICNSITSLPPALSLRATASTSKAVSPVRLRANVESVALMRRVAWGSGNVRCCDDRAAGARRLRPNFPDP